jgi:hypothetical protein
MMKRFLFIAVLASVLVGVMGLDQAFALSVQLEQFGQTSVVTDNGSADANPAIGAITGTRNNNGTNTTFEAALLGSPGQHTLSLSGTVQWGSVIGTSATLSVSHDGYIGTFPLTSSITGTTQGTVQHSVFGAALTILVASS